jgi:hypothetical protein
VRVASRAESVGEAEEVGLVDGVKHLDGRALDDLVLQRRHAERPLPSIGLGDVDSFDRLRPVRPSFQPLGKVSEVLLQGLSILPPRHTVDTGRGVPLQAEICLPEPVDVVDVKPEVGEPQLSIPNRCFPYSLQRTLQVQSGLRPGPGLLWRVALGQPPFLHPLRRWRSGPATFVRRLRRYYEAVRLPTPVHHRRAPFGFSMRTVAPSLATAGRGTSRFPHGVRERMRRVFDRAGLPRCSRCRTERYGLPLPPTESAPGSGSCFSRLNTGPTLSPVNASALPSRTELHDLGPLWVASPSTSKTFISNTPPVFTGAIRRFQ